MSQHVRISRQHTTAKPRWKWLQYVAACAGIILIGHYLWQEKVQEGLKKRQDSFHQTINHYFELHPTDEWWLTQSPQVANTELVNISVGAKKLVDTAIKQYAGVSPETRKIAKTFSNYHVSYSTGSSSLTVTQGDIKPQLQDPGIEICFYAKQEQAYHPEAVYYRKEWDAVMIAAFTMPQKVFAALLYHELGHALYNSEERPSATAINGSDSWVGEEVDMHTLEADVLNSASKGAYFAKLDAILRRSTIATPESAYLALNMEDLKELDTLFGCQKGGKKLVGVLLAEHMLMLGFRYIDMKLPVNQRLSAKIAVYTAIQSY